MKRVMVIGSVGAGKTSLTHQLTGHRGAVAKTQVTCLVQHVLDTPGEYLDHRGYHHALLLASYDVDAVVMVESAIDGPTRLPAGFATYFTCPVLGVVNKVDAASTAQRQSARQDLVNAGADPVLEVSCLTGVGLDQLREVLA